MTERAWPVSHIPKFHLKVNPLIGFGGAEIREIGTVTSVRLLGMEDGSVYLSHPLILECI